MLQKTGLELDQRHGHEDFLVTIIGVYGGLRSLRNLGGHFFLRLRAQKIQFFCAILGVVEKFFFQNFFA